MLTSRDWEKLNQKLHGLETSIRRGRVLANANKLNLVIQKLKENKENICDQGGDPTEWIDNLLPGLLTFCQDS